MAGCKVYNVLNDFGNLKYHNPVASKILMIARLAIGMLAKKDNTIKSKAPIDKPAAKSFAEDTIRTRCLRSV